MVSEQTRNKLTTIAENEQKVYDNGVADGKQAEYDAFWDMITHNWTRKDYRWGLRLKCQYIRPPRKIIPTGDQSVCYMFADNPDLLKIEKEYFDFSQKSIPNQTAGYYGHQRVFANCRNLVEIEDVGMQPAYYDGTFYDCLKLEKIEVVRSQEDTFYNLQSFGYCTKLQHLVIEGVIGTDFNIKWSPLSPASLTSIITHLKDYLGTANGWVYTLTVKASAWTELNAAGFTDEALDWVERKYNIPKDEFLNLGVTWTDLVSGLGWNLVLA